MIRTYRIADKKIKINSLFENVHSLCEAYVYDGSDYDFEVVITEDDIAFERTRSEHGTISQDPYLEELAVYRKISDKMPEFGTFLIHGSCVSVDGEGYLFIARSGVGKSTHSKNWMDLFDGRAVMVNDDKPLVHADENGVTIYGTPYNGKHRRGANMSVPLKAVCVLKRGEENTIRRISPEEVFQYLVQQTYRPSDKMVYKKVLELLNILCKSCRFYELHCNTDISSAQVAYDGMKG